jgi:hypothetical protein
MPKDERKLVGRQVPAPPGWEAVDGIPTIYLELPRERLEKIFLYFEDPPDVFHDSALHIGGTIRFYSTSGSPPLEAALLFTWFPSGRWMITPSRSDGDIHLLGSVRKVWSGADPTILAAFDDREKQGSRLIQWEFVKDPEANTKRLNALLRATVNHPIKLAVVHHPIDGHAKALDSAQPFIGDSRVLLDERVAEIFLELVEHFGNLEVDYGLARGGLTEEKLKKVAEPKPALVDAITERFTQGYVEFATAAKAATLAPSLEEFKRLEEVLFFQARARNDLALRNMLRIGVGLLADKKGARQDIGILRRPCADGSACVGDTRWLLYDRHGTALRGLTAAFGDPEYRSVDLEKLRREAVFPVPLPGIPVQLVVRGVPIVEIDVQDRSIYRFLRAIEQDFGGPPRELVALAASQFNYGLFIAQELHERSKAEVLAGRTIELAAGVFLFFVVHAFAAFSMKSPHPAMRAMGFLLMALARAVGAILGVDFALTNMEKLARAGRHFAQMERIHRESAGKSSESSSGRQAGQGPGEIPKLEKAKLTRLSEGHLKAGAEALLDAMADYFALGVMLTGGLGIAKIAKSRRDAQVARAIAEHIQQSEEEARSKLTVDDEGGVKEVEPLKGAGTLEQVPAPKAGKASKGVGGLGSEKPPLDGKPKPEKKTPAWGAHFFDRCDNFKKRVEALKEHLDKAVRPEDPERAKLLDDLRGRRTEYLLNSIDLIRRSKGERVLPVLKREVQEFEADVEKDFPRPVPEEPPRESEGLYVIQEPGELQGEPQRGKVPKHGQSGGPFWREWDVIDESAAPEATKQFNDSACGAACAEMLLKSRGVPLTQHEIAAALPQLTSEEALPRIMSKLDSTGRRWYARLYDADDSIGGSKIQSLLKSGPFMANTRQPLVRIGHWIVIDAIENGEVMIRDPWSGTKYRLKVSQFDKWWSGLVISGGE